MRCYHIIVDMFTEKLFKCFKYFNTNCSSDTPEPKLKKDAKAVSLEFAIKNLKFQKNSY